MASKVHIAVICIFLCSVICILDGCERQRYIRCEAFGKFYDNGKIHRIIHRKTCLHLECKHHRWKYVKNECNFHGVCHPAGKVMIIGGVKHQCYDTGSNGKWLKVL
ncbi:hypothetical protein PoB_001961700 [Plakobranchus ocellatus]|uniref:Uncharacterized protein n=1 Tax=Plakobranchus ocellatus TaxID=259542 RepID=A0AAV3ZF02_9GAST|nr:hypothetical protein PoB_001961700 [Plakobranchus ocellatus]